MQLLASNTPDWTYVLLTHEESDVFFDPYDPWDRTLPSHLHHQRFRFIKVFIYDWLQENVGDVVLQHAWSHQRHLLDARAFCFANPDHALLFKVFWDGYRP